MVYEFLDLIGVFEVREDAAVELGVKRLNLTP
jgi:hypothetical protein